MKYHPDKCDSSGRNKQLARIYTISMCERGCERVGRMIRGGGGGAGVFVFIYVQIRSVAVRSFVIGRRISIVKSNVTTASAGAQTTKAANGF